MDDLLPALAFAVVIGAQFLAVIAARRVQPKAPQDALQAPDAARLRYIWLFG